MSVNLVGQFSRQRYFLISYVILQLIHNKYIHKNGGLYGE